MKERACELCGNPIPESRGSHAKYCSERCARKAQLTPENRRRIQNRTKLQKSRDERIIAAYHHRCALCGWQIASECIPGTGHFIHQGGCHVHHVEPVNEGGSNDIGNLILLCPNHHAMAHAGVVTREELRQHMLSEEEITAAYENYVFNSLMHAAEATDKAF